jgi:hypothetical protein
MCEMRVSTIDVGAQVPNTSLGSSSRGVKVRRIDQAGCNRAPASHRSHHAFQTRP